MQITFLNKKNNYDGSFLRSHFIFDTTGLIGNACVAFIGACDVSLVHMVDLMDKKANCKIVSEEMLHFIIEHFDQNLEAMILRQRLFVSIIGEHLAKKGVNIDRRGNDLYDGPAKINISVATISPISCLMHVGVNISSHGTPVETKGLNDYDIEPKEFAEEVMKAYCAELAGVEIARCKVRGVN